MKALTILCIGIGFISSLPGATGQSDSTMVINWEHNPEINLYFMPDDFLAIPVYSTDHGWLHLEARFNYEDVKTFSAWAGYNFSGGKEFRYTFIPMAGLVFGNINGLAPGFEMTLEYAGFELYSESEYVFDLQQQENDFYYNWTDLTYSPVNWLWLGISGQRTMLYRTELDVQRGLLLGGGYRQFGITGYIYNMGWDDPYFILSLSVDIP